MFIIQYFLLRKIKLKSFVMLNKVCFRNVYLFLCKKNYNFSLYLFISIKSYKNLF